MTSLLLHGSVLACAILVASGVLPLDSIAPRERAPTGPDRKPAPGRRRTKAPMVRINVDATRGLPRSVIILILRQNYGRFRACYEKGLARRPDLHGEVRLRFVIERDGSTTNPKDDGSDLPDASVIRCLADAVDVQSFPSPWEATKDGTMNVLLHLGLSVE
jgi:hypothetical protein